MRNSDLRKLLVRENSRCAIGKVLEKTLSPQLLFRGSTEMAEALAAVAGEASRYPSRVGLEFLAPFAYVRPRSRDLVGSSNVDQAYNEMLLTQHFHTRFGKLKLWFEPTDVRNIWLATMNL